MPPKLIRWDPLYHPDKASTCAFCSCTCKAGRGVDIYRPIGGNAYRVCDDCYGVVAWFNTFCGRISDLTEGL